MAVKLGQPRRALAAWSLLLWGATSAQAEAPHAPWPPALTALVQQANQALQQGDADAALLRYEQAAASVHDAHIELGMLRAQMQRGQYRHALAFAAHTAGVHADEAAGRVFYAWLLDLGAQAPMARQQLQMIPGAAQPQADALRGWWLQRDAGAQPAWPVSMAQGDVAFGPVPLGEPLPAGLMQVASAWLLPDGLHALAPRLDGACKAAQAGGPTPTWVRNGLGQTVVAEVQAHDDVAGMAMLRLTASLLADATQCWAPQDAPAGSPAYALGHQPQGGSSATWPLMRAGFVGRAGRLGVALPALAQRGGPVYDAAGRLVGLSGTASGGADTLWPASALRAQWGDVLGPVDEPVRRPAVDGEEVYERGLRSTLQVWCAAP